jgi:hypothetical protein
MLPKTNYSNPSANRILPTADLKYPQFSIYIIFPTTEFGFIYQLFLISSHTEKIGG